MPATPAFPPPWVAEENERRDANGQALTYVYFGGDRPSLRYPIAQTARGRNWPHNGRRSGYCGPAITPAVWVSWV